MRRLFLVELRRYRVPLIAAAAGILVVLALLGRIVDLMAQPRAVLGAGGILIGLLGVGLGAHQIGVYRRLPRWMQLLHRPLSPARIGLGLLGAGATLLAVAVVVPTTLFLVSQALFSAHVVDARHWLLPLAAAQLAVLAYLTTAYFLLSPTRWSAVVVVLPLAPMMLRAGGGAYLAVVTGLIVVAAGLVLSVFRPERTAPPRRRGVELGVALVLAVALHLALEVAGTMTYQYLGMVFGWHPLNGKPPPGGLTEAARASAAESFAPLLARLDHPDAAQWRVQAGIAPAHELGPDFVDLPRRGQLTDPAPVTLDDDEHGVTWSFSHDAMRFRGVARGDGADRGWLGVCGADTPFPAVPRMARGGMALAGGVLYVYDTEHQTLCPRFTLPDGEVFAAMPAEADGRWALLGDQAFYILPRRALAADAPRFVPRRIPLPRPVRELMRLDWLELLDDDLVVFTYGRGNPDGQSDPWQALVYVDAAGASHRLAEREPHPDFPALMRHAAFTLSPVLFLVRAGLFRAGAPAPRLAVDPLGAALRVPPRHVILVMLGLAALALAGLAWKWRRDDGLLWWGFVALTGLPGLAAFLVLRRGRR